MVMRKLREQHGESKTTLFKRWSSMRNRVSPKWPSRKRYYDRGIGICPEWDVFSVFKEWSLSNGFEDHLELDRKDNNKGYSPENCRWITHYRNTLNRENTIYVKVDGTSIDITTYGKSLGKTDHEIKTARKRVCQLGWSPYDAINKPIGKYR